MNEPAPVQDARRYLGMLHKRRALAVTCVGASFLVALLYNYTTRPVYQATAQILIDVNNPQVLPTKELVDMDQPGADFQTQLQLLRGRALAERVVERLELQNSQEFQTGPLLTPWERLRLRVLGKAPSNRDTRGIPLPPAVTAFVSRLGVEPVPASRLVNLKFSAYDPKLAARVTNALAQMYIERAMEFRYTKSSEASDWLEDHLKEQKRRAEEAEQKLQAYREREGLVNSDDKLSLGDQKVAAVAAAALNARTERIAKESLYTQMRSLPPSQLASFPAVLSNTVVQSLRAKVVELQQQQSRLSESLGERHPDMVRLQSEIEGTEGRLRSEIQNVVRAVESDYRTSAQQEARLQANLEEAKREALAGDSKAIEYGALKREVDSNQQLYRDLLNRTKQTGLETELKSTNVRIVEKAEVPRGPFSPQRTKNYQIALAVGLGLGIALTLLFEHIDNTLKTPEDVKEHLGLPFLGIVPDAAVKAGPAQNAHASRPSPLILANTKSSAAEVYRVVRTNLIFSTAQQDGRGFVVTSTNPGEGKTTTTANLATSLALNGARVLVVDADLRRPTLHQLLGVTKTPGLTDLIVGKCQASQAIQQTRLKGLQALPCGYLPPNPAELLGSASMREIFRALRSHYDWVLLDTPPILAMADTSVLCPMADGVILVVEAEVSGRPAIQRAVDQITKVGGKVTGVVLNKVDLQRNSYYYGQYYGEYYQGYYYGEAQKPATARPRLVQGAGRRS